MGSTKSGVHRMVKILVSSFFVIFLNTARAEIIAGISTNSWQEVLPIQIANVQSDALSSFTGLGVSLGYQYNYAERIRYVTSLALVAGSTDVHKQSNAIAPRRNFNSIWFSNKVVWRSTRSFTFGPNFVLNYRKIDDLQGIMSFGLFLDIDYELFQEIRLTQSLGTMSDSKQLAYSISLNRIF